MQQFEHIIRDPLGIHARPAGLLSKEGKKYQSAITVDKDAFAKALISYLGVQDLAPVTPFGSSPSHTRNDTVVLKIAAYINEHYKESITLQFLSDKFFMSKNTLCKRFRSAMDISVMQYVTYVRLNKAKMYLTTTAKSMDEVAEHSGFPSANYFSFIFKKSFGISPTEYRKKH